MQLLATAGGEVQIPYLIPYFWMKVWNLNFFSCQSRYRWKIVEATLNPNSVLFFRLALSRIEFRRRKHWVRPWIQRRAFYGDSNDGRFENKEFKWSLYLCRGFAKASRGLAQLRLALPKIQSFVLPGEASATENYRRTFGDASAMILRY